MRLRWPAPLEDRPFRLMWFAASTSAVGSAFVPVALAFAVFRSGGNATSLGLVLLAGTVAGLVAYIVGGVWADQMSRRGLMAAADLARMLVQAAVAAVLLTGQARIWMLVVASVINSVAWSVFQPASTGLVAQLVPDSKLHKANSLLSVTMSGALLVGPALSGLLVAASGVGWSFALDAASFAGSAAFLAAMPTLGLAERAKRRFFADLAEGWHEVTKRTWYWTNLIAHAVWNLAFCAFLVLGPVLALRRLDGAVGWGLVSTGLAAGALIGGLVAMRVSGRRPLVTGNLALMLAALPLLAFAARLPLLIVVACAVVGASGGNILNIAWTTVVQQLIPNEVLGRVRSYDYTLAYIAMPAGYAAAGPLAASFGADRVLVAAAGLIVVCPAVAIVMPSVRAITRQPDGTIVRSPRRAGKVSSAVGASSSQV
jgi:MFS family permease